MNIEDLSPLVPFGFHHHLHGRGLGLKVGLESPDLRGFSFRMWQDQCTRDPLHGLKGYGPLAFQLLPAPLPAMEEFRVPGLCLGKPSFCTNDLFFHLSRSPAYLLVRPLKEFCEGKIYVLCDPVDFSSPLLRGFL